jgi:hypothetical protein
MNLNLLKENHTYLIKGYYSHDNLKSITVVSVTNEAYELKWNDNNYTSWVLKKVLDSENSFVEDITDHIRDKEINNFKNNCEVKFYFNNTEVKLQPYFLLEETCKTCGGEKKIPDLHSTGCYKTCPACNGTGKQSKKIQIFTE